MKHGVSTPKRLNGIARKISTSLATWSLSSWLEYAAPASCRDLVPSSVVCRFATRCAASCSARFPYAVYIAYLPLELVVVAVAHQHRKPGYWRKRLARVTP
jgi:hypothetical protein